MRGFFNWLAGIPADTPVSLGESQARLFAAQFVKRMARQVLMTLTWVRRACTVIMLGAMYVSFSHQYGYLMVLGAGMGAAIAIPMIFDCLTFVCVKVLATSAVITRAKWFAVGGLIFAVGGSGTLNFLPPGPLVLKYVFVGAMCGIAVAELVASQIKPDFLKMAAMEALLIPLDAAMAGSAPVPALVVVASVPVVSPAVEPEPAVTPVDTVEATETVPDPAPVVEPEPVVVDAPIRTRRRPRRASKEATARVDRAHAAKAAVTHEAVTVAAEAPAYTVPSID
jgi:hypothetical protein